VATSRGAFSLLAALPAAKGGTGRLVGVDDYEAGTDASSAEAVPPILVTVRAIAVA
jgi:hypothetical protein